MIKRLLCALLALVCLLSQALAEETVTRYFASFGLTWDVLLERSCDWLLEEKLQAAYTDGMEGTKDELLMAFVDWQLEVFDEYEIIEDEDAIEHLIATLWDD